ncbi:MAG TPA: hypothetical protein DCR93_31635 [Cytophagales bacterium]|nr:hypothetical protein [Cytophagales bacterium]HAP63850.1 hypothetical protein [Cytophagales bacterium]
MIKRTLFFLLLLSLSTISWSQERPLVGLWEVTQVTVGDRVMTPVAKWYHMTEDGRYTAGNGWLRNGVGTWSYDAETGMLSPKADLDLIDPAGPFTVTFGEEGMIWQREEDGMAVTVHLELRDELPKGPSDRIVGMWKLEGITAEAEAGAENHSADPYIHIRWDRIYRSINPGAPNTTGYWHFNGHRPEVTFLPHTEGEPAETWEVDAQDEALILTGISDTNRGVHRMYQRYREWPQ